MWSTGRVGPVEVATWMSAGPARLAGLDDRGAIAVGRRADLCVFDPSCAWTVDPGRLHHRQPVTPYAGRTLTGQVVATWLAGTEVTACAYS